MDNHLAAGWCWLNELNSEEQYYFYHIDRHTDLLNNVPKRSYSSIKRGCSLEEYLNCSYSQNNSIKLSEYKSFRWGTYIKNIQKLHPNWFCENYFATHEEARDSSKNGKLKIKANRSPFFLCDPIDIYTDKKWIVNLDLDYFFCKSSIDENQKRFKMFSDQYIRNFSKDINGLMKNIAVMTIAFSPECCGGWNNAIDVYNILTEEISSLSNSRVNQEFNRFMC